jgi:hypothetical protein
VEIRLIDPPDDIKKAMHKQKTAEQERRSMKLLATGEFEAAEQQKLAVIQGAQGKAGPSGWSTKPPKSISSATPKRSRNWRWSKTLCAKMQRS